MKKLATVAAVLAAIYAVVVYWFEASARHMLGQHLWIVLAQFAVSFLWLFAVLVIVRAVYKGVIRLFSRDSSGTTTHKIVPESDGYKS